MYIFKLIRSDSATEEEFMSAVHCAVVCIESQFDGDDVVISTNDGDIIVASDVLGRPIGMTLQECKSKLVGCFCDSAGQLYPEFERVIPRLDSPN